MYLCTQNSLAGNVRIKPMRSKWRVMFVSMRCMVLGSLGAAVILIGQHFWRIWPGRGQSFDPIQVVSERPPITEFKVRESDSADEVIDDTELVLGVVVEGEARAYPINMLTGPSREIINDTLGSRPIAATW